MPSNQPVPDHPGLFVVTSELQVRPEASEALVGSFRDRIGLVDRWDDFERLEVWQDHADPGRFVMTSWWTSRAAFVEYMRSDDHRRSHARVPTGADRPRPVAVDRYQLVAR